MFVSYRGFESFVQMDDIGLSAVLPKATSNCCTTFSCLPSFFGGIFVLALVEIVCLVYFVHRLLNRKPSHPSSTSSLEYASEAGSISFSLQGDLWVAPLPEGDWTKAVLQKQGKDKKKEKDGEKDGSTKDGSKRGESAHDALEIAPMWRHVILKEGSLVLKGSDGIEEHISLEGCEVVAVSAGATEGGKWARKHPIRLQHPSRALYRDCKACLFYVESGYEKEAWCEVLRATAKANDWCTKLKQEFREYTDGVEKHLPFVSRFHSAKEANHFIAASKDDKSDEEKNSEENVSKKQRFLNKLLRRNSKGKNNNKESVRSANAKEELGNFTRRFSQAQNEGSSRKERTSSISEEPEDSKNGSRGSHASISRSESTSSDSDGEKSHLALTHKDRKDSDEVLPAALMHGPENEGVENEIDQGLLGLNMIVGRMFFDFYHSQSRVAWIQSHFQRLLSKIKTPNYIKSITIKELDLGRDPPFATGLRVLPADSAGALALEVDLEWYGGGFITIETRVDVRDQIAQEKVASQMAEPGSAGAAAAAIVSGIGEDLETADVNAVLDARQAAVTKKPGPGDESSRKARWINSVKSMMTRVADQVSQVPLLLKIRLVKVKGTIIISLRAPPSDRIWFTFKGMPEIDMAPEPCIGDHRISSGPLHNFIANQIKVQIRESIVTPYCQDLFLHWMMAEKDDWIPTTDIPVAFSAVQGSENERQVPKPSSDAAQPKPVEENDKSDESKGQITDSPAQSIGHGSPAPSPVQSTRSPSQGPPAAAAAAAPPTHPSQPQSGGPQVSRNQSRFAPNSEQQPSLEHSVPSRASAPPSLREGNESDLTTPLLEDESFSLSRDSSIDLDSDRLATARPIVLSQLSEGSASLSESELPSHQWQVGNPEQSRADLLKDPEASASSRRTKMLSLGKKGISRLEEKRRIVLEKLREKRAEAAEGGSSHQGSSHHGSSGHFGSLHR